MQSVYVYYVDLLNDMKTTVKTFWICMLLMLTCSISGKAIDLVQVDDRMAGTVATTVMGYERGCSIFRVHDVKENYQALMMAKAIRNEKLY